MRTQHSALKLCFFVQPKINTKPLSKTMKYFFIMLHVVFALDFGFIKLKSPKLNVLIKLITIIQSTALSVVLALTFFDPNFKNLYTYSAFFLDTLLYYVFTLTLVVLKYSFHDYQTDLNSFDVEIELDSSTCRVEYKIIFGFLFLVFYRCFMIIMYYVYSLDYFHFSIYSQIIYNNGLLGLDTVLVVYTYAFYSAHLRLKNFTSFVNNVNTDMVSCQYLYKNIADIINKVKKSFDVILILTLVSNTIDATMHIYVPFANEKFKLATPLHAAAAYLIVVQQMLVLFSPAFTAGLLAGQVEKLRLVLYKKLINGEARPAYTKDIRRFVSYIDARPLRFRVWRVVPLDWRLPVIVINISITYLIVMIQFTHTD